MHVDERSFEEWQSKKNLENLSIGTSSKLFNAFKLIVEVRVNVVKQFVETEYSDGGLRDSLINWMS